MASKLARARGVPISFDKDGINVHFKGRDKDVQKLMKDIEKDKKLKGRGPVGKFFSEDSLKKLMEICDAKIGDSVFLACGKDRANHIKTKST